MNTDFLTYGIPLFFALSLIYLILIGSILRDYYQGKKRFKFLQKFLLFFSEIPSIIFFNLKKLPITNYFYKPTILLKHKDKKKFYKFISNKREGLLVLPRYDHYEGRSLVEIIDLDNFKIIHTYKHNIADMNKKIKNKKKFKGLYTIIGPRKFLYWHPLILDDGSLICDGNIGPEFKIDFNSNLKWINDELIFHHSKMLDHEGNIWLGGRLVDRSKYLKKYSLNEVNDDAIVKINSNGEILLKKSVIEILFENKIWDKNNITELKKNYTPTHLNSIEPAFSDTKYWKKGDIFINLKHQKMIILYRPSTNKIINTITGPFSMQHDINIISENEISIFNNNNFIFDNKYSEVVIYNFETHQFRKLFNSQLQKENFKTYLSGKGQVLADGSLFVEEQRHGRIILFNKNGQKEWEFINKSTNGDIGYTGCCRIIEDKLFVKKFKQLVDNKEN